MARMIRKITACLLLAALLTGGLAALADDQWYLEKGLELAGREQALAADEAYIKMFTMDTDTSEIAAGFGAANRTAPKQTRLFQLNSGSLAEQLTEQLIPAAADSALSDAARSELKKRLPGLFTNVLCGQSGVKWISTSSLLSVGATCVKPEDFVPAVLFLEYDDDYALAVTFSDSGEDTLTMGTTLLPSDALGAADGTNVIQFLLGALFRTIPLD